MRWQPNTLVSKINRVRLHVLYFDRRGDADPGIVDQHVERAAIYALRFADRAVCHLLFKHVEREDVQVQFSRQSPADAVRPPPVVGCCAWWRIPFAPSRAKCSALRRPKPEEQPVIRIALPPKSRAGTSASSCARAHCRGEGPGSGSSGQQVRRDRSGMMGLLL